MADFLPRRDHLFVLLLDPHLEHRDFAFELADRLNRLETLLTQPIFLVEGRLLELLERLRLPRQRLRCLRLFKRLVHELRLQIVDLHDRRRCSLLGRRFRRALARLLLLIAFRLELVLRQRKLRNALILVGDV